MPTGVIPKTVVQVVSWYARCASVTQAQYRTGGYEDPSNSSTTFHTNKPITRKTLHLRHYLCMVKNQRLREALTSVMISTHLLAAERFRYADHAHQPAPRQVRVCRFCRLLVETPEYLYWNVQASLPFSSSEDFSWRNVLRHGRIHLSAHKHPSDYTPSSGSHLYHSRLATTHSRASPSFPVSRLSSGPASNIYHVLHLRLPSVALPSSSPESR